MSFTEEEIKDFRTEADELMELAEKSLLDLDRGEALSGHYDSIFRALHSIKGAAGMMDMKELQEHMHQLETIFTKHKSDHTLSKHLTDLFLRGLDATRRLINGEIVHFEYVLASAHPSTPAPSSNVLPINQRSETKPHSLGKVLIVDDEPDMVEVLIDILKLQNIETLGITDSKSVMSAIEQFKPDAMFSDISMPELNGLDLLAQISKVYPDLPVIFISGYVSKEALMKGLQHGVYGVIEKPFDSHRVAEAAINAIESHKLAKMFTRSINLLMYQFSDLSEYLKLQGRHDIHKTIADEITSLLDQRRLLRHRKKKIADESAS